MKSFSLILLLGLLFCKPSFERSFFSYLGMLVFYQTSSNTASTQTQTLSAPTITNLKNNSIVETGFLIGTAAGTLTAVEVSLDSSAYAQASGTASWKFQLPTGSNTWKEFSKHTVSVRANKNGVYSAVTTITVVKGKNKDINGDGYSDLVVGAPEYNTDEGRVYIFYSKGGTPISSGTYSIADSTLTGIASSRFGGAIAQGDINGDGYGDIVVGATENPANTGSVFIFHSGGSSGIGSGGTGNAFRTITGDVTVGTESYSFGESIALGDINGDGYSDLAVGASEHRNGGGTFRGAVYIFLSTGSGSITQTQASSFDSRIHALGNNDRIGTAVAFGDFNSDGYSDLVIGGKVYIGTEGRVWIFHSQGTTGIASNTIGSATVNISSSGNILLGASLSAIDVNGDGYSDLVVGGEGNGSNPGNVFIFHSTGPTGISATASVGNFASKITGFANNSHLGSSVSTGDFNCDGFGDFIAGGQDYNFSGAQGHIIVGISNGSSGITFTTYSGANNNIASASSPSLFGISVGALDFNGDGCTDIFAGGHTTGASVQGALYYFQSAGTGFASINSASQANAVITGINLNDKFGQSLAK
ncbi:MAG TPA: FG-GAP and VCBS repeat-containing protein [Leptospiraceae bacterium]|nr:FG-GAP and VCBS repeat-containing protein [Leptospiraceae bacterium]